MTPEPIFSTEQAWPWDPYRDSHPKNFQSFNQAESETGFWLSSETNNGNIQCLEPSVQSVASRVQGLASSIRSPASRVQCPESSIQSPASRVQRSESSVQSPTSNTCVQSPGIPLSPFALHNNQCYISIRYYVFLFSLISVFLFSLISKKKYTS